MAADQSAGGEFPPSLPDAKAEHERLAGEIREHDKRYYQNDARFMRVTPGMRV